MTNTGRCIFCVPENVVKFMRACDAIQSARLPNDGNKVFLC